MKTYGEETNQRFGITATRATTNMPQISAYNESRLALAKWPKPSRGAYSPRTSDQTPLSQMKTAIILHTNANGFRILCITRACRTVLLTQVQPRWCVPVFRWFHGWIFGLNPDPVNFIFNELHLPSDLLQARPGRPFRTAIIGVQRHAGFLIPTPIEELRIEANDGMR